MIADSKLPMKEPKVARITEITSPDIVVKRSWDEKPGDWLDVGDGDDGTIRARFVRESNGE
jgi:hypothetical protein